MPTETTYDPWTAPHVLQWGRPIHEALTHARAILAVHDLHVEVAISITPITHAEPEGDAPAPPSPTGNYCDCGGPMVQTGSCETCQWCGASSGGCG